MLILGKCDKFSTMNDYHSLSGNGESTGNVSNVFASNLKHCSIFNTKFIYFHMIIYVLNVIFNTNNSLCLDQTANLLVLHTEGINGIKIIFKNS